MPSSTGRSRDRQPTRTSSVNARISTSAPRRAPRVDPDARFVGGYVDWEWRHARTSSTAWPARARRAVLELGPTWARPRSSSPRSAPRSPPSIPTPAWCRSPAPTPPVTGSAGASASPTSPTPPCSLAEPELHLGLRATACWSTCLPGRSPACCARSTACSPRRDRRRSRHQQPPLAPRAALATLVDQLPPRRSTGPSSPCPRSADHGRERAAHPRGYEDRMARDRGRLFVDLKARMGRGGNAIRAAHGWLPAPAGPGHGGSDDHDAAAEAITSRPAITLILTAPSERRASVVRGGSGGRRSPRRARMSIGTAWTSVPPLPPRAAVRFALGGSLRARLGSCSWRGHVGLPTRPEE